MHSLRANARASVYSSPVTSRSFDVVGIGENSVDYVYRAPGSVAPNAKLQAPEYRVSCGGQVATTLAACATFGLRAAYIGTFGNDDNSKHIRQELAHRRVDTRHSILRDAPNRHAVILVDERNGDRTVVWHRDPRLALTADEIPREAIVRARLLHVDDLDEDASIAAARVATDRGIPITSDIDRVTDKASTLIALSTVAILSSHVPAALTGESDPERALRKLRGVRPLESADIKGSDPWVCVTLGAEGALLLEGDRLHRVPAHPVEAVDTTAAGDVFRAAFIYALLKGRSPIDILRFANAAAGVCCTRKGAMASVPALSDVERMLHTGQ